MKAQKQVKKWYRNVEDADYQLQEYEEMLRKAETLDRDVNQLAIGIQ
jgi:hypothetical protein